MQKSISTYKYKSLVKKDRIVIIYSFFSFFIGQVVFFSFANPFFAPFLSLYLGRNNVVFLMILIPLLIGCFMSFKGVILYTYVLIGILMLLSNIYINHQNIKPNNRVRGIFSAICVFLGGTIPVFFYSMSTYFAFYFLIFTLVSSILPTVLSSGFDILTFKKSTRTISLEETISISIILSAVIMGVLQTDIQKFNLFLFMITLCTLIVSSSQLKNQTITLVFIICLVPFVEAKISANELVILLFSAFSTLFIKSEKKPFIILSVTISFLLSYLYIDSSFFVQKNILAISFAFIVFLLFPNDYYNSLQATYGVVDNTFYPYAKKITQYTSSVLSNYSRSFKNLSESFVETVEINNNIKAYEKRNLYKKICREICLECENYSVCFVDMGYTTENAIKILINEMDKPLPNLLETQTETFKKICVNNQRFFEALNKEVEILRNNLKWENKINQNKVLLSEQLNEISKVFLNIKDDVSKNVIFMPKTEKKIFNSLEASNIFPTKVLVIKNKESIINVFITLDINYTEKDAFKVITKICSDITQKELKVIKTIFLENGNLQIHLSEFMPFDVSFGISSRKKDENNVSGDSFSAMILENGKALIAVSDGMGSGEDASISSKNALNLFEDFLESGFDKNTAIKLINSSLILKNRSDSFTTLDACLIDLYKGYAEFIKIGAVPSFIIRNKQVFSINSSSLPIGILNNIDTEIYKKQLKENDFVILLSDGVLDVIKSYDEQEKWIKKVLKSFDGKSSKDLSEHIIKESLILSKNKIQDDMTVVVCKIKKHRYSV